MEPRFWENKPLDAMTRAEWEALCDGCGRCCLVKLRSAGSGRVHYTGVSCEFLDTHTCRCLQYEHRTRHKPSCLVLTSAELADALEWLPDSCAYRLIAENRHLPDWHPLVTGDPESVHEAGMSVRGKSFPEQFVSKDDLADYIYPDD